MAEPRFTGTKRVKSEGFGFILPRKIKNSTPTLAKEAFPWKKQASLLSSILHGTFRFKVKYLLRKS
jgi:hypothetical protein